MDKQSLILIALELDLPDIINYCKSYKIYNEAICKNSNFWLSKLRRDFGYSFYVNKEDAKYYYIFLYKINKENPDTVAKEVLRRGYRDLTKYIIDNYSYFDPIMTLEEAAMIEDMDMIEYILNKFPEMNIDFGGRGAAKVGNIKIFKYFLDIFEEKYKSSPWYNMLRVNFISLAIKGSISAGEKAREIFDYLYSLLLPSEQEDVKDHFYGAMYEATRLKREDMINYLLSLGFKHMK